MKKQIYLSLFFASVLVMSACSQKGFSSASLNSTSQASTSFDSGNNGGLDNPTNPNQPAADPLTKIDLKGRVDSDNSSYSKALAFDFDKIRGEFIIMVPFPSGVMFTPAGSFSKYPDITFSPIIDAEGRMKFAVRIPVKYIIKGSGFLPPTSLPNGDALPAMPQGYGELPSLGLNFPAHDNTQVTLYIGVNAVGLFVTLPPKAALPFKFSFPIKNADKSKTFGYLSYVPAKGTYPPGMFVSTIIPPSVSRILEDYFHL
ncbi:MAG: hypothetical protein H7328_07335 [Bdellovibrio sp.]|nr:hypothetical protein [Bdellovibrio sp.]